MITNIYPFSEKMKNFSEKNFSFEHPKVKSLENSSYQGVDLPYFMTVSTNCIRNLQVWVCL